MARLPVPGDDAGNWGNLLNEYLEVTHDTGGALKTSVVADAQVSSDAAISADKLADGTTNKIMTATERTKLAGVATNADVTNATTVGTAMTGATAKTTPVDADTVPLNDSAASNALRKVTWANIKATLKTYFDTLYATTSAISSAITAERSATAILTNKTINATNNTVTNVGLSSLSATGTKDSTTYLRGDNTWATVTVASDSTKVDKATYTAKGSMLVATAASTPANLPVGTNGHILTADSAETSGVKWAAVPSDATKAPTASPTFTGTATFGGPVVVTPDTVAYGANVAINASLGNHFRITMTGNLTLDTPTNPADGQRILIELIQDGTGGRTLSLGTSNFNVTTSITGALTLVTTANTRSYIGAVYRSSGAKWDVLAFGTGVAA